MENKVKDALELLQRDSHQGDVASSRALYDFYQKLRNPLYKLEYPPATKLLKDFGLLDEQERVSQAVRDILNTGDPRKE